MTQLKLFDQNTLFFYGDEQYKAFSDYCNNLTDKCVYHMKKPNKRGYYTEIEAFNNEGTVAIWQR